MFTPGHLTKEQKEIVQAAIDQHEELDSLMDKAHNKPNEITPTERERIVKFYSGGIGSDERRAYHDIRDLYDAFRKFKKDIRVSVLQPEPRVYRVHVQHSTSMFELTEIVQGIKHSRPDLLFAIEPAKHL